MKKISTFARALFIGPLLALLVGCQNPYDKFYTRTLPEGFERYLIPHTGGTQFVSAPENEMKQGVETLVGRGYNVLGYASFEANARDYSSALHKKAEELQADIVLVSSAYARTQSGVIPLITYQPGQTSTTYSSGQVNANAYGTGGSVYGTANYSGVSTTTASGTFNTNYIPYSVERRTFSAVFLRRYHYLIGARWKPLDDEQRRALQRNSGLCVVFVIEGTPAFRANILPGDILLTLDNEPIESPDWLNAKSLEKAGQLVKFSVLRNGTEKTIELRINSATP